MERARAYSRAYSATPCGRERGRKHRQAYRRLYVHGEEVFGEALAPGETVTLGELRARVADHLGVEFRKGTLRQANDYLASRHGTAPLVETEPGHYRLNANFYNG